MRGEGGRNGKMRIEGGERGLGREGCKKKMGRRQKKWVVEWKMGVREEMSVFVADW